MTAPKSRHEEEEEEEERVIDLRNFTRGIRKSPEFICWRDASERIQDATRPFHGTDRAVVVGIGGPPGAGKSTLAQRLGANVISIDDYNWDFENLQTENYDLPETANLDQLYTDLIQLRSGQCVTTPVWSHLTHRREGTKIVTPSSLVVCEGIHALHRTILSALDVRVIVSARSDTRWRRWELLEKNQERGWGIEKARRYFQDIAEPTYARFEKEYLAAADFVVQNDGDATG